MRVIAGEFKSRRLKAPAGDECRPTPDRLREALFSILQPRISGAVFLDAYAGCGAVGMEALSRGAARAAFVERNRKHADILRENLKALGVEGRAQVIVGKASDVVTHQTADIVFADPPYTAPEEYERFIAALTVRPPAPLLLLQHSPRQKLPERIGEAVRFRELKQGDNWVTFYRPAAAANE
jgi:16S rRNA (guanine966-N2)-methyltransferase